MNSLHFKFSCLDGNYSFSALYDKGILCYIVQTNIPGLSNKVEEISDDRLGEFLLELEKAHIEKWDKKYLSNGNGIEDATSWKVQYFNNEMEYTSYGEETFEPYDYNHLIKALIVCDNKATYFLI